MKTETNITVEIIKLEEAGMYAKKMEENSSRHDVMEMWKMRKHEIEDKLASLYWVIDKQTILIPYWYGNENEKNSTD